jgi:hypothetical protein
MSLHNFVCLFTDSFPRLSHSTGNSTGKMTEADSRMRVSRKCCACTIGINTLVEARFYGDDVDDKQFYPGVVVGFSRDGYMVKFEEYEEDPVQDTKPEDVRVYTDDSAPKTIEGTTSGSSGSNQSSVSVEPAHNAGFLLPLGDKRKNKPYTCSVFCETNRFYHCGGCPTCNEYYTSIGRRNPHVLLDKRKFLVQQCAPDAALVELHYADVCRKNPMWHKDKNGTPIVPDSFQPFMVQVAKRRLKKARIEAAYEAHDDAVQAAVVAEKSKVLAVAPLPYKCSPMCKFGKFATTGGCPTCNEYYKLIGLTNPIVTRGEGIVQEPYDEETLRKHYEAVCKNNPEWAKDDTGKPVVPTTYGNVKV